MRTSLEKAKRVKEKLDAQLLRLEGVNGSAVKMADGHYYLAVYVSKLDNGLKRAIPKKMEGTEVRVEEIGETKFL